MAGSIPTTTAAAGTGLPTTRPAHARGGGGTTTGPAAPATPPGLVQQVFRLYAPAANVVTLYCPAFSEHVWQFFPMRSDGKGTWVSDPIALVPGKAFEYQYIVDGKHDTDPTQPTKDNCYGGKNNVVTPKQGPAMLGSTTVTPCGCGPAVDNGPKEIEVSGTLVDSAGQPVGCVPVDVVVSVPPNTPTHQDIWQSDDKGRFSGKLTVGPYDVISLNFPATVRLPGGATGVLRQAARMEVQNKGQNIDLGKRIYDLASVQVGGTVEREVIDDDGQVHWEPVEGLVVKLAGDDGRALSGDTTGGDGGFLIAGDFHDLAAKTQGGLAALEVRFPREFPAAAGGGAVYELDQPRVGVAAAFGEVLPLAGPVRYKLRRGQIVGQVSDGGKGLPGVSVVLRDPRTKQTRSAQSDSTGTYHFDDMPPGHYELTFPDPYVDAAGVKWEPHGHKAGRQTVTVASGRVAAPEPVVYAEEEHAIEWTVTYEDGTTPAEGKLVELKDAGGKMVLQQKVTDGDGFVRFEVDEEGDYVVCVHSDDRSIAGNLCQKVSVHSTATGGSQIGNRPAGFAARTNGRAGGGGGGGSLGAAVDEIASFPVLTEEVDFTGGTLSGGGGAGSGSVGGGGAALGRLVEGAIRDVLGWRPKAGDGKGLVAALNQSFTAKEVEGRVDYTWNPRNYSVEVTATLGAITGAQASIHARAKSAVDQILPLLDNLQPLLPDADPQDLDAIRAIVRGEIVELPNELAMEGGPRVQRVDELFDLLLGTSSLTDAEQLDPRSKLAILRTRFGLRRNRINTIEEEQTFTNYLIILDQLKALRLTWNNSRPYFARGAGGPGAPEPFLGTQLVLLSRALAVVAESVQEVYFTMNSVFVGPAERQTIRLNYPGESPLYVAELLSWVERFAAEEGPRLLQDGGKDGVIAFEPTIQRLQGLVQGAMLDTQGGQQQAVGLTAGYRTPRVQRAIRELGEQLGEARTLAAQIADAAEQDRQNVA